MDKKGLIANLAHRLTAPFQPLKPSPVSIGQDQVIIGPLSPDRPASRNSAGFYKSSSKPILPTEHNENRYRAMIENSTDLIYVIDREGKFTYVSPISTHLIGYTPQEMVGCKAMEFIHPQDREDLASTFQSILELEKNQLTIEMRLSDKHDSWRPFEALVTNLLTDPTVAGIVVNCRDLSERKQAQKLQESIYKISEAAYQAKSMEELFKAMHAIISELMPAQNFYVALYDENTQMLLFPYYVDEYDLPPGPQPLGRGLTEYVLRTGDPLLASPEKYQELIDQGEVVQIGTPSIDWLGVPLRTSDKPLGVLVVQSYTENVRFNEVHKGILTFVSEQAAMSIARKKMEAALRESEERYRGLFENSPISLWEEDFSEIKQHIDQIRQQGIEDIEVYFEQHPEAVAECMSLVRVVDINQTTLKMYTANSKEELFGNLSKVFGKETLDLVMAELVAIAQEQHEFEGIGVNHRINGKRMDIVLRWSTFPENDSSYSRVIVSIVDITERRRTEEQIQSQIQRLNALRTIDTSITGSLDLKSTLNVLLDQVTSQLNVDAAAVLLLDPNILALEYAAGRGFMTAALQHTHLRLGEGYAGRAALERRLISNPDLQNDPGQLSNSPLLEKEGFYAYFGTPLISKGQVKGVLEIFHRAPLHPSQEWLEFLETLGRQAAIAIDNATLFNELQRSNTELTLAYDATIVGWSRALDLRDRETEGHTQRVTELTIRLAQKMGVPKTSLVYVRWGALLHDIGKMGIPDNILLKPGPLTPEEFAVMRKHPVYAYQMLLPINYLRPALDIPYYHHEHWDGNGYPCGLKKEEIPLAARIFSVVDVWDALLSERPYRKAWGENKARQFILSQSSHQFDPMIVEIFLKMIDDDKGSAF